MREENLSAMQVEADSPTLSKRDFTLCMMGHSAFQYIYAALELSLFDLLFHKPGLTRKDIAEMLQLDYLPIRCLLLGLTALGFLQKSEDRYFNTVFVDELHKNNKFDLLLKFSRFQAKIVYPGQIDFLDSLRSNRNAGLQRFAGSGKDLYTRIAEDPSLQSIFFEFMSAWSAESLPLLLAGVDLREVRQITDVGGGDATIAVGLAQAYPHLKVKLIDIPSVCSLAQNRISASGLADRVQALNRNVFEEDFPSDSDCFLFAHFLVIWSPEENIKLLRKAYSALPQGGRVIIFNSMASDDEDGPLFAALDCAYFIAVPSQGGLIYSQRDYEMWLEMAGFREIQSVPCKSWWTPHRIVVGIKN